MLREGFSELFTVSTAYLCQDRTKFRVQQFVLCVTKGVIRLLRSRQDLQEPSCEMNLHPEQYL